MDCKLDKDLLQDLLEGVIEPIEKLFVEEHLKSCQECRKELTELKLLFWDLNDKSNYEIELPVELDQIKDSLLKQTIGKASESTVTALINIQRNNIRTAGKFLDYVPGATASNNLVKESLKATPSVIRKVSKGLIKSTKLLLAK
ncbi:zf-HC2 domain-containing protein [Desulfitobacterium sp. Sab5]|uniref:zf-HC2 domain-containing protein n=1 Tax=Desulfitobacterium nosdiversum TaxID=3375356 RepID=UPI003CF26DC3